MEGIIMLGDGKQGAAQQAATLGVGVAASVTVAIIAAASQAPWLLSIPFAFGAGLLAWFGAEQIRRGIDEGRVKGQIDAEYRAKLDQIRTIAERIGDISQSGFLPAESAEQIGEINRIVLRLLRRFNARQIITWAYSTLLIIERFIQQLEEYHDMVSGELFVRDADRKKKTAEMEQEKLPLLIKMLYEIGIRLDEGRYQTDVVWKTMKSMAESLGLLESLKQQLGEPPQEEDSHE